MSGFEHVTIDVPDPFPQNDPPAAPKAAERAPVSMGFVVTAEKLEEYERQIEEWEDDPIALDNWLRRQMLMMLLLRRDMALKPPPGRGGVRIQDHSLTQFAEIAGAVGKHTSESGHGRLDRPNTSAK